ncbi:lantibiotic ABC transporter permease [Trichococcus sp. K1Tr]|uniref:lantibiotic ABC transporter permease n=1 Tax=Trichococcus sp. K1Tr TaxID=3020847 RepID=UPI00232C2B04|nr:lantibiotic ABC transporter permease [Trichococcus sp. K1Tr]MDB6354180.1 lantibiotic ABC transporter permease [Trichococcus sp. K1Tr]
MILIIARMFLFILSIYGFKWLLQQFLGIDPKVGWIAACCLNILILYFGAFAGMLESTAIVLAIVGWSFASCGLYSKFRKKKLFQPRLNLINIGLLVYFLLFAYTLLNTKLEHADNFSHWATIVKFLYTESRLPTASDTIISFGSYPLGSSLFVYYATKMAGFSDGAMLIGQFLLIYSCVIALFAPVRDESRTLVVAMNFSLLAVFNYFNVSIRMSNLLVDFLLPLLTLAGIAGIYSMRKNIKALSVYFILIASVLSLIKNSAIFFVGILFIYYLYTVVVARKWFGKIWHLPANVLAVYGASLIPYIMWTIHVGQQFSSSKHAVSLSRYQQIFLEKDASITAEITEKFMAALADFTSIPSQGILLFNFVMIASYISIRFFVKRNNSILRCTVIVDLIIVAYYIGMYVMSLFSMPTEEALVLAVFERYASSIIIFSLGIAMMVLSREIDYSLFEQGIQSRNHRSFKNLTTKKVYQFSSMGLLFFATIMLLSENNDMMYNNMYKNSVPYAFSEIVENQMTMSSERYLVISADKEAIEDGLISYVGKYYLYSPNVEAVENFMMDDDSFLNLIQKYDKIVVLDDHNTFNAMTNKLIDTQFEPGIYAVDEYF